MDEVLPMDYEDVEEPFLPKETLGHMATGKVMNFQRGKMLLLNSKRLVLEQLRTLASMLGICGICITHHVA